MARITIQDETRRIEDPQEIRDFLEPFGIWYEKWDVDGRIDEVGYFNVVVTPEDIATIMNKGLSEILGGSAVAIDPQPAHGAIDVPRDRVLGWMPGMFAQTHNVYIGTSYSDVEAASVANPLGVLVAENQAGNTFDRARAYEFGQT